MRTISLQTMASIFSRNIVCYHYKIPISTLLPAKSRRFSLAASHSTSNSPLLKSDRRRFKIAGALTLTGILAGIYYGYITNGSSTTSLNTVTFTPYTLDSKTPITSGPTQTTIFTLSPPRSSTPPPLLPLSTGILSIQIKQPQLQIARSYTPLPLDRNGNIRLLIKKEPSGEMSRYLYSLKEGDVVEIRGPEVEYVYPRQGHKKIVFFAGGTGIAPALQMVVGSQLLQEREGHGREAEILWAVRHKEETLGAMEEEIDRLVGKAKDAGSKLTIWKFVDSEGGIKIHDIETAITTKDEKTSSRVFVSGPEGFIAWIAGPKDLRNGKEEQGILGGMLEAVAKKAGGNIEVFKL